MSDEGLGLHHANVARELSISENNLRVRLHRARAALESRPAEPGTQTPPTSATGDGRLVDPVCGMEVDGGSRGYSRMHEGKEYRFCSLGCVENFEARPERFLKGGRGS